MGVNVCGAGVDGYDSSNSLNRVSSTRSKDNVASNEEVDVNRECLDSDCTRPVLSEIVTVLVLFCLLMSIVLMRLKFLPFR